MAHHLDEACCPRPWVVDLVDALSLGMERRIARERGPRRLAARVEAARLRAYEREVTARADASLVASRRDLAALGGGPGLAIVPNAVDLEAFPCAREGREAATVAFTGNMGYFSNVDAAVYFVKEVFPRLRRAEPQARFLIVGARPARAVRALAAEPGVSVTGPVEDVGAFLRRATVAVCPMRTGSGQQIKILEAMASGAPVVATPAEAEQVDGRHDHELLVGADAAELCAHVAALFADPARAERLARNARRLVEARFTWERSVAALEQAYEAALAARRTLRPAAGRPA
jgi:glycosyltransferase involved in cell wall biosynthesis